MEIKRSQNVSFNGTVKFAKQSDAENKLLRPLINHLKHHCNGEFRISYNKDLYIGVSTTYEGTAKGINVVSGKPTDKHIYQIIGWSNGINHWRKSLKDKKSQTLTDIPPREKSIGILKKMTERFLHRN